MPPEVTPSEWSSARVRAALRTPDLDILRDDATGFVAPGGGRFPIVDGILCLLPEAERGADLGDGRFYDRHPFGEAARTDPDAVAAGVEGELRELLREYPRSALVLDVGAGAGRVFKYLRLQGFENAVGVDFSLASLRRLCAGDQSACIWGNNLQLPLATAAFDLVISTGVAHHTSDPHRAIEECLRVLAPGGRLYLRVYNRQSLYYCVHRTYGALLRGLDSRPATRRLGEIVGFAAYKWLRQALLSRPALPERLLRARYGNLFLKRQVYFFTADEIEALMQRHHLQVESASRQGSTHRMHCYVVRKPV